MTDDEHDPLEVPDDPWDPISAEWEDVIAQEKARNRTWYLARKRRQLAQQNGRVEDDPGRR